MQFTGMNNSEQLVECFNWPEHADDSLEYTYIQAKANVEASRAVKLILRIYFDFVRVYVIDSECVLTPSAKNAYSCHRCALPPPAFLSFLFCGSRQILRALFEYSILLIPHLFGGEEG